MSPFLSSKRRWVALMGLWVGCLTAPLSWAESTVLVMGDSLSDAYNLPESAGWVALLGESLGPDIQVINASISGETSAGGALRLPSLLKDHEPDVVIIILGGNDGLRALHPDQLKAHLAQMIEQSHSAGAQVGLMQVRLPPNLGPAYIDRFEAVYPQLAEAYDVALIPFFLVDFFDQPGMLMEDGIHPTANAQPLMLSAVQPHIEALLFHATNGSSHHD